MLIDGKNSFSGYGYGYRALAIYNIMGKHLDTAEFKAKKIVEQARGEADSIIAEADHNAERKVKIAQIHADGIVASAEQTAVKTKQQAQKYLDGIVQSVEAERNKPTPKRKRQAEEELSALRTENAALRPIEGYLRPRSKRPVRAVAESRTPSQRQGTGVRNGKRYARRLPRRVRRFAK